MAPKIGMDEDGDIPPCSVMWDRKYAEKWDARKQEKYKGAQKAQPCVERFKHMWEKREVEPVKKVSWWKKILSCFKKT